MTKDTCHARSQHVKACPVKRDDPPGREGAVGKRAAENQERFGGARCPESNHGAVPPVGPRESPNTPRFKADWCGLPSAPDVI